MVKKEEPGFGEGEDGEKVEEEVHGEKGEDLTPWEQHSSVIRLPRYDYRAPSCLIDCSHSGFLITCPIKREKSATKEAISLLEEYVGRMSVCSLEKLESCTTSVAAKKRKICSAEIDTGNVENAERNGDYSTFENVGIVAMEGNLAPGTSKITKRSLHLSLVKLTRSGLLLFTFPSNSFRHAVDILSAVFCSLGSGKLDPPLWCHRIFPIQETCILIEKDLQAVVSKLVQEYLGNEEEKLDKPIKFAVGYNRRGIYETEMKVQEEDQEDPKGLPLLDRDKCFQVVAGAVKAVAKNSVVDLKSPEVAVLVELLPLSGIPHGSLVVGVSILPRDLVTTKPRLCVRSLIADTKVPKRKG